MFKRHSNRCTPRPKRPESAMCVQEFDDSLNPAIHITYRISLRSSSLREPRYPLLKVVFYDYWFARGGLSKNKKLAPESAFESSSPPRRS